MSVSFAEGEPCWIDMSVPDVAAGADFYRRLFGWEAEDLGAEAGHYTILRRDGAQIGGIGPAGDDGPPWWIPYFKVADAEAAAARVESAGGKVTTPPMDVFGQLVMAACTAPDGARFAVCRLTGHPGAEAWGEIGAPATLNLLADEAEAADFYRDVFGWRTTGETTDPELVAPKADRPFGSMHVMHPQHRPPGAEPAWTVVFRVTDVDATAATAAELGASITVGPVDLPGVGRTAFLQDPDRAGFSICTPN